MNKLLLSALIATGAFVGSALFAEVDVAMPYEDQIAFIREGFANTLEALGNTALDQQPQFASALLILPDAMEIIKTQAKSTTIVPAATKAKLMSAMNGISTVLINLKEAKTQEERIAIAQKAIKTLQTKLNTLKTGLFDIYKTPTDLKNAVRNATEKFIETLKKWVAGQAVEIYQAPKTEERSEKPQLSPNELCQTLNLKTQEAKNECLQIAPVFLEDMKNVKDRESWKKAMLKYHPDRNDGKEVYIGLQRVLYSSKPA
ncbi:MAG: hypothetical protein UV38_C0003G0045 [candidate division TM6 bacterium GW2011_GWE2_42_60]|nr:MAG: hypothetical protein UV38_C0003G0045 [candidate division TM6 bacterium GW2011_GWE2_42_60]HBY05473.1 hypothetical protein [Candidatus Dependentiae bacterium]